jgi:hypothetical protein
MLSVMAANLQIQPFTELINNTEFYKAFMVFIQTFTAFAAVNFCSYSFTGV